MSDNTATVLSADARQTDDAKEIIAVVTAHLQKGSFEVPSLPEVAVRIGKVVSDPGTDNTDIARVIQADPAVTARFLSTVNSPGYIGGVKVQRLVDGVGRLGRERTRSLVVALVLRTAFRTRSPMIRERMERLWGHSSLIAALCFALTQSTEHLDPDRALLAGLVHDIGVIPLLRKAVLFPQLTRNSRMMESYLTALRPTCSAYILRKWGFPDDLVEAARLAQHCSRSHDHRSDYTDVVIAAHLIALSTERRFNRPIPLDRVPAIVAVTRDMDGSFSVSEFLDDASRNINMMQSLLRG